MISMPKFKYVGNLSENSHSWKSRTIWMSKSDTVYPRKKLWSFAIKINGCELDPVVDCFKYIINIILHYQILTDFCGCFIAYQTDSNWLVYAILEANRAPNILS